MTRENRMKLGIIGFLFLALTIPSWKAWAQEDGLFSGKASLEGGLYSPSSHGTYALSRLLLKNEDDLASDLLFSFAGEADGQTGGADLSPSWPLYPQTNFLRLQTDNLSNGTGNLYTLQLDRALLKWTEGSLEVK